METEPLFIQILGSIPILDYFAHFYREVISQADKITGQWTFMSSPDIPATIVLAYLCTVMLLGPFLMRYFKVPAVKELLIVYNSIVLLLNLWLGISFTWHIWGAGYQLGCQKVGKFGRHENSIADLIWIFHCSKIVELIDTLFLVLKKKGNQLTFLHLYHHSTIVVATWIGVKFAPGGSSAVISMVNSWIHVFMYFYYEMMVLRVKSFRGYKKFVTIMQIVQFLATIVHCTTALKRDCGYPKWILQWLLLYMISFLVLFIHFYVQTYWRPKVKSKVAEVKVIQEEHKADSNVKELGSSNPIFSEDDEPYQSKSIEVVQILQNGKTFVKNGFTPAPVDKTGQNGSKVINGKNETDKRSDSDSQYSTTDDDEIESSNLKPSDSDSETDNENDTGKNRSDSGINDLNTQSIPLQKNETNKLN